MRGEGTRQIADRREGTRNITPDDLFGPAAEVPELPGPEGEGRRERRPGWPSGQWRAAIAYSRGSGAASPRQDYLCLMACRDIMIMPRLPLTGRLVMDGRLMCQPPTGPRQAKPFVMIVWSDQRLTNI